MKRILWSCCALTLFATSAWAGGSIETNVEGKALKWSTSASLVYNPENAPLKSNGAYNTQQSLQLLTNAFALWTNQPGIQLNAQQGAFLNVPNQSQIFDPAWRDACYPEFFPPSNLPCVSPIIFDENGELTDEIFGQNARFSVLGFAGFDDADDGSTDSARTVIKRGIGVFNGTCIAPIQNGCQKALTSKEVELTIQHEIGHMLGMDHSQVNTEAFAQCVTDPNGCSQASANALPLMFPIALPGAQRTGLHADDKAYFQKLYGNSASACQVTGTIFGSDGSTEFRGAEVLAINTNPNLSNTDVISFVSGAEAPRFTKDGENQGNCRGNCGDFTINGLQDGQTYQLCVQALNENFTGGSRIAPMDPPFSNFVGFCQEGLTVTCDCDGNSCSNFNGKDITTDVDPSLLEVPDGGSGDNGGGCSLIRPKGPSVWQVMQKAMHRLS